MIEQVTITCTRYRTSEGKLTCGIDVQTGDICEFYRKQRFGCSPTCALAPAGGKGYLEELDQYEPLGYLIPGYWCPLFKEEK